MTQENYKNDQVGGERTSELVIPDGSPEREQRIGKANSTADDMAVAWGCKTIAHLEEARQVLGAVRRLVLATAWLVAAALLLIAVVAQIW